MCESTIVIRQKRAWNNERLCAVIIRRLGAILAVVAPQYKSFLLMDSVRFHTAELVLAACKAMPLSPIIIPPSRTWLLQPLDAGAFSPFKHILTELYQGARACSEAGEVSLQDLSLIHI